MTMAAPAGALSSGHPSLPAALCAAYAQIDGSRCGIEEPRCDGAGGLATNSNEFVLLFSSGHEGGPVTPSS